jgi:hypothetical protein
MKLLMGWAVSVGLVFAAAAANAQALTPYQAARSPYTAVSDVGGPGPYAVMPPEAPPPGYGPRLLPPMEVYTIVRESGFSPLGIPQQRGLIYTISVIDRGGDDGRLVIDARSGRIIRFIPAYRMGDNFNDDLNLAYGPVGPLPPLNSNYRRAPRPPLPIPHVASRSATPLPKAPPHTARPAAAPQQSAASQVRPAPAPAAAAAPAVEAKPSVQLQPTQEMPKAQGLD